MDYYSGITYGGQEVMPLKPVYTIIHGHFYQPPREDPWTDEIETQESAAPFHDWNERINRECYAANAASRVIDSFGRIEAIINNYAYMSYNFGPTLVDWLSQHDPRTLARIVEADRLSQARLGQGNAIAQVYNHTILPLATDADKITQVVWGLRHFEKTFGRPSQGIWLAETAVNERTAEILVDLGIRFIILSPTQAQEVLYQGHESWTDVSHNSIDPSRPYRLETRNGSLAVFFYYGDIASRLSFEHLLTNVDHLRGALLAPADPERENNMVNVATDGESYGHHEPFGDMCLARLVYENQEREEFVFGNYAHYLEMFPPQDLVHLKHGNNGLGTAWSCAHGVGRWFEDCGCQTGGHHEWHQQWRGPLREAFDYLRDQLHRLAGEELRPWLKDVWAARNDYIDVISAPVDQRPAALEKWFSEHTRKTPRGEEHSLIVRIMEALHQAMLMYTSCGWFFSEISGIETVQDMRYAARVLDLTEDVLPAQTRSTFLRMLEQAPSNIPRFVHGRKIMEDFILAHQFDRRRVIHQHLLRCRLSGEDLPLQVWEEVYFYRIRVNQSARLQHPDWQVFTHRVELQDRLIGDVETYLAYIVENNGEYTSFVKSYIDDSLLTYLDKVCQQPNLRVVNRELRDWFRDSFSILDMKYEVRQQILSSLHASRLSVLHRRGGSGDLDVEEFLAVLKQYREWQVSLPEQDLLSIRNLLSNHVAEELGVMHQQGSDHYDFSDLIRVILAARASELPVDHTHTATLLQAEALSHLSGAVQGLKTDEINRLDRLIEFANLAGLEFEKSEVQDALYFRLLDHQQGRSVLAPEDHQRLCRLADRFNIAVHHFQ